MKKIRIYISLIIVGGLLAFLPSCNDFLEREPLDGFTDQNYWTSEDNVRTYSWKFYSQFMAYGKGVGTTAEFYYQWGGATMNISDDLTANTLTVYEATPSASNTNWNDYFKWVHWANFMLERIPQVPMTDEAKEHWEGVGLFFRSLCYYRLVQLFGDVPYYNQTVKDVNDVQYIYSPRMPRNEVMDNILADLNKAIGLLRETDQTNTINKNVALALKSRMCIYEGTYRKYHNKGDGKAYLEAAKDAAFKLIDSKKYSLGTNTYQSVYNSENLSGNSEMILYKEYVNGTQSHSIQAFTNTSTVVNGMTKAAIDSYVCEDGLPISQSPLYKGDKGIDNVLSGRDPRLLVTVDDEGIAFRGNTEPLSGLRKSSTGYVTSLYNNPASGVVTTTGQNNIDAPIFAYAEVLLNYAEACAELDGMTQGDLDISVNLLRKRAGIAELKISGSDVMASNVIINDPKRTSALEQITGVVSPLIWEIRRERRAELMTWTQLRYNDLMRWKKGDYLDYEKNVDVSLGAWLDASKFDEKEVENIKLDANGYIKVYQDSKRPFNPAKDYLNAIPTGQISLYTSNGVDFPQNPGWGN